MIIVIIKQEEKMKIQIVQIFHVERIIAIDVDAADEASAVERVASGETDAPAFEDSRWESYWNLQSESVEPLKN